MPGIRGITWAAALAAMVKLAGLDAFQADDAVSAIDRIAAQSAGQTPPFVLVAGSLYLAGRILEAKGTIPACSNPPKRTAKGRNAVPCQ